MGEVVVRLLESRDAKKFAQEITPSLDDWRTLQATNNAAKQNAPLGPGFDRGLEIRRREMAANAERVLDKANALGLSRARFSVKEVTAKNLSTYRPPQIPAEQDPMPWAYGIEVVLKGASLQLDPKSEILRGEYRVLVASGEKFLTGWRCQEGIRWKSLPEGVADAQTTWELNFLNKWSTPFCDLTLADDPALAQLGNILARFVMGGDEN